MRSRAACDVDAHTTHLNCAHIPHTATALIHPLPYPAPTSPTPSIKSTLPHTFDAPSHLILGQRVLHAGAAHAALVHDSTGQHQHMGLPSDARVHNVKQHLGPALTAHEERAQHHTPRN